MLGVARPVLLAVALGLVPTALVPQAPEPLLRLTAPARVLPAGCGLVPPSPAPSEFLGVSANPAIVTNPFAIGFMASLVVPATAAELAAGPPAGTLPDTQAVRRDIERRAAAIEAAYVAGYRQEGVRGEIGIYALRFRGPVPASLHDAVAAPEVPGRLLRVSGRVAIMAWVDGDAAACFAAVRDHLKSVTF